MINLCSSSGNELSDSTKEGNTKEHPVMHPNFRKSLLPMEFISTGTEGIESIVRQTNIALESKVAF